MNYTLVRSNRKTLCVSITPAGEVVVRAPQRLAKREIDRFVAAHAEWIAEHMEKARLRAEKYPEPDEAERAALIERAKAVLPPLVEKHARSMGVSPAGLKITGARRRFGSCSGKNSLCFSLYLMRYPMEAIEYVVVHELAHILEKNHGPAFYAVVAEEMPDYKARAALLKAR